MESIAFQEAAALQGRIEDLTKQMSKLAPVPVDPKIIAKRTAASAAVDAASKVLIKAKAAFEAAHKAFFDAEQLADQEATAERLKLQEECKVCETGRDAILRKFLPEVKVKLTPSEVATITGR